MGQRYSKSTVTARQRRRDHSHHGSEHLVIVWALTVDLGQTVGCNEGVRTIREGEDVLDMPFLTAHGPTEGPVGSDRLHRRKRGELGGADIGNPRLDEQDGGQRAHNPRSRRRGSPG